MLLFDPLTHEEKDIEPIIYDERSTDYILSMPHSGRCFIPSEIHRFDMSQPVLLDTDLYTDQVYDTGSGTMLSHSFNQYMINMNRQRLPERKGEPYCLFTPALWGGDFLVKPYSEKDRIPLLDIYDYYHHKLAQAIQIMKKKHGYAVVFDCHSMNSFRLSNAPGKDKRDDIVVGTLDDASAHPSLIEVFMSELKSIAGDLTIAKNDPYKGGFITWNYSNPPQNVHVIQIETKKLNYMHESYEEGFELKPSGLERLNRIFTHVFDSVAQRASRIIKP